VTISDCTFRYLGSNGIFVSKHARNIEIERNVFKLIEGTPMMLVGDPLYLHEKPWDRRFDEEFVSGVQIRNNVAHDLGLVEIQSCAVMLSICKDVTIEKNVFYNGPRGAVVLNDVFAGDFHIQQNVLFGFVQEVGFTIYVFSLFPVKAVYVSPTFLVIFSLYLATFNFYG
jgi:hypothetical protein